MKQNIPVARAREVLAYDPDTGMFRWLVTLSNRSEAGTLAGQHIHSDGYARISFDQETYLAHLLAWAMFYGEQPEGDVDHENLNRGDNRIKNLRPATRSQNMANRGAPRSNTSGCKGVTWNKASGKWQAGIRVNYKRFHLGLFADIDAAAAAYEAAAAIHFGKFGRA